MAGIHPTLKELQFVKVWLIRELLITTAGKLIGLHQLLDGVTNPEYKLLHFIQLTKFFAKRRRH